MSEEAQTEGEESEDTTEDSGTGNKPETMSPIEQANAINQELGRKLEEYKTLVARQEQLAANQLLQGRSNAGQKEEKVEESPEEYKKRVMGE